MKYLSYRFYSGFGIKEVIPNSMCKNHILHRKGERARRGQQKVLAWGYFLGFSSADSVLTKN